MYINTDDRDSNSDWACYPDAEQPSEGAIRAVAEGQVLEVIKQAFAYTPENDTRDREVVLAYLNGRGTGRLKGRCKKVDIRSLWSGLPGRISMSRTRIETGNDETYAVQRADGSVLDQKCSDQLAYAVTTIYP